MTASLKSGNAPDTFSLSAPERAPIDVPAFREAMASLAATVCVVTSTENGLRLGRTVTAVFSLSATPPSILISLDTHAEIVDMIRRNNTFSLAMLAQDQQQIADAFAGAVPADKRFAASNWSSWTSGNPRLAGAAVNIDCDIIGTMEIGAHTLYAGAIVEMQAVPGSTPLLYHNRHYATPVLPLITAG